MITDTKTVIETRRSRMTLSQFSDRDLMLACINDIADNLPHYPSIIISGREVQQRRDVGFFSDESEGYRYSGQMARSQPLTENLKTLMGIMNKHYEAQFNGILINRYNHGRDYIGAHSDDETYLDTKAGVVAISVGAERTFVIRGKVDTRFVAGIPLPDMSIVHMSGDFQKEFTHQIPPVLQADTRYSFTFRHHQK